MDLVGRAQVMLQTRRLKVAAAMAEAGTLTRKLQSFKVKPAPVGGDYEHWREGQHDGLVFSVALALWASEHYPPWDWEAIRQAFEWR